MITFQIYMTFFLIIFWYWWHTDDSVFNFVFAFVLCFFFFQILFSVLFLVQFIDVILLLFSVSTFTFIGISVADFLTAPVNVGLLYHIVNTANTKIPMSHNLKTPRH